MIFRCSLIFALLAVVGVRLSADETLYRYEGNVVPYDESLAEQDRWLVFDACEDRCSESLEDGHFVLSHDGVGDQANYKLSIAGASDPPPPPTLWVEWRFRSNHPIGINFSSCDGGFVFDYIRVFDVVNMYGDAAISFGGDFAVLGLDINEFHTYRFESTDGVSFTVAVDGQVFIDLVDTGAAEGAFLQMHGRGACDLFPNAVQEWDFVRYGTIDAGEQVIAAGFIANQRDRLKLTFDAPNYVYIDDITVTVTGGVAPRVIATQRAEGDLSDRVVIVLDRPMPTGETTTFKIDTGLPINCDETLGEVVNCVEFSTEVTGGGFCGDGVLSTGVEECDNGEDNSDVIPDACRTDCTLPSCGDAVTDTGEQCDNGSSNSDTLPDTCRTTCTLPTCGDNVADNGEECDGTSDNACPGDPVKPGGRCLPDCTCEIPGIPTLSHWGLLALAVLLLALSKRQFGAIRASRGPT